MGLIQWKRMDSMLPPPAQSHDTAARASLSSISGTGAPIHPTLLCCHHHRIKMPPLAQTAPPPGRQGGHRRRLLPIPDRAAWVSSLLPATTRSRPRRAQGRRAAVLLGMASRRSSCDCGDRRRGLVGASPVRSLPVLSSPLTGAAASPARSLAGGRSPALLALALAYMSKFSPCNAGFSLTNACMRPCSLIL